MTVPIENLTALVQGRELNSYQRSLAAQEFQQLLNQISASQFRHDMDEMTIKELENNKLNKI